MKSLFSVIIVACSASLLNAETPKDYGTGHWLIRGFLAQEHVENHKATMNEFGDCCVVRGYIFGVSAQGNGKLWLCPPNTTKRQLIAIIVKYMNAHPEDWGDDADKIISRALIEVFPISNFVKT